MSAAKKREDEWEIPKDLPVYRTHPDEINAAYSLLAMCNDLEIVQEKMDKRLRAIRYGKRNLGLIRAVLKRLTYLLLWTFPTEKKVMIQRNMHTMTYKVACGPQASRYKPDDCFVDAKDLLAICQVAHEKCDICIEDDCRNCRLSRAYDRTMKVDRDGRKWADVNEIDWVGVPD